MTTYDLKVCFAVQPVRLIEEFVDEFMEALLEESTIIDPDLGVNLENGRVDARMMVEAVGQDSAMVTGFSALRSALHKIGSATRDWEVDLAHALATVRPPELAA